MVQRFYWKLYFSQLSENEVQCRWTQFNPASSLSTQSCGLGFVERTLSSCFHDRRSNWLVSFFLLFKVARYSFSGSIPPKYEQKLRRQKQSFGKIATTVVLDEDENLLWSGLQRHRSCHGNKMTLLHILIKAAYLGTGNCSSKINHGSFFLQ